MCTLLGSFPGPRKESFARTHEVQASFAHGKSISLSKGRPLTVSKHPLIFLESDKKLDLIEQNLNFTNLSYITEVEKNFHVEMM